MVIEISPSLSLSPSLHQLHLVVHVHAIGENPDIERFFGIVNKIYNFVRHPTLTPIYKGTKLNRLVEQRWDGHLDSTSRIIENHDELVELFQICGKNRNADICVDADGLLKHIRQEKFMFIAYMVHHILLKLSPVDKLLQDRTCDITTGLELINKSLESIKDMRSNIDETYLTLSSNLEKHQSLRQQKIRRPRQLPSRLHDQIIMSTLGHNSEDLSEPDCHRRILIEVLESCIGELEARFSERNCAILVSMSKLRPHTSDFLDPHKLQDFFNFIGLPMNDALRSELDVAKKYIIDNSSSGSSIGDVCKFLYSVRRAFPDVYKMYASALTFGASSSVCEASFSSLKRVLTPYRRSMTHRRKSNLVMLAFMHKYTKEVDFEVFLKRFSMSNRRLQLF